MKHVREQLCAALLAAALPAAGQNPRPADVLDIDRPFDQYLWITAHNAANHGSLIPNQSIDIFRQLQRGVRGLMLDIYERDGRLVTCHADCASHGRKAPLEDDLRLVDSFLDTNPDAVVTLHLEDHNTRQAMQAFTRNFPELFRRSFNPDDPQWAMHGTAWPTLRELITADQRLLITSQRAELSGTYPPSRAYFMHDQAITAENYWSLGATIFTHDPSCRPRWDHVPLNKRGSAYDLPRLFVMNHFHGVPVRLHSSTDNRLDIVQNRLSTHCLPAAERMPNYLAIDFIERGDMLELAETFNNGGLLAFADNHAQGDPMCSFSTAFDRTWSLVAEPRMGCENDEIRSLQFRGARQGQRITLYDSPEGNQADDYTVIDVLQDIPWESPEFIQTLEQDADTPRLRVRHHRVNGLDGKVSRIAVRSAGNH